jgi:predicted lipoprotein with Yx(FWY)xxD motif
MTRTRSITFLAGATALVVAALAAGCGSSGGSNANSPASLKNASGQSATVGVANENVGKILVDSQGRTLYLFERDSGTKSTCTGACAVEWPPLRATGKPTVGGGATASVVTTSARSDGKPQVTYNGHPLYLFSADQKAGDTNGQGVNAFGGLSGTCCPRRATKSLRPRAPVGALATRTTREMGRERRTPRAPRRDEFPWPTEPG